MARARKVDPIMKMDCWKAKAMIEKEIMPESTPPIARWRSWTLEESFLIM